MARYSAMYNSFILVGPLDDPTSVDGLEFASDAFIKIISLKAPFESRGEQSGTHSRKMALWKVAGFEA